MFKKIQANVFTNLRLYWRSKLLLVMLIILGIVTLLSFLITFATESPQGKFSVISGAIFVLQELSKIFGITLMIFGVSKQIGDRSIKLVITKPAPTYTWVLSNFISTIGVITVFTSIAMLLNIAAFSAYKIPIEPGMFYVHIAHIFEVMIFASFGSFLTVVLPSIIAGLIVIVVRDLFVGWVTGMVKDIADMPLPKAAYVIFTGIQYFFHGLYIALPAARPFRESTKFIYEKYNLVETGDWKYFAATAGYAILVSLVFLSLTNIMLRRKRLI